MSNTIKIILVVVILFLLALGYYFFIYVPGKAAAALNNGNAKTGPAGTSGTGTGGGGSPLILTNDNQLVIPKTENIGSGFKSAITGKSLTITGLTQSSIKSKFFKI